MTEYEQENKMVCHCFTIGKEVHLVRLSARSVIPSRFSIASRTISRERPWSNIYIERTRNHTFANSVLPRSCNGVNDWERKGMIS
jgi:hypothetical protein